MRYAWATAGRPRPPARRPTPPSCPAARADGPPPTVNTIVFAAPLPAPFLALARAMTPAGFDIRFHAQSAPGFLDAVRAADYLATGFVRGGMGKEFYAAAPRLRLVQLI